MKNKRGDHFLEQDAWKWPGDGEEHHSFKSKHRFCYSF
jgi:hypothetical protein